MNRAELVKEIFSKKTFLSVGLDTDIKKIPKFLLDFFIHIFFQDVNYSGIFIFPPDLECSECIALSLLKIQ